MSLRVIIPFFIPLRCGREIFMELVCTHVKVFSKACRLKCPCSQHGQELSFFKLLPCPLPPVLHCVLHANSTEGNDHQQRGVCSDHSNLLGLPPQNEQLFEWTFEESFQKLSRAVGTQCQSKCTMLLAPWHVKKNAMLFYHGGNVLSFLADWKPSQKWCCESQRNPQVCPLLAAPSLLSDQSWHWAAIIRTKVPLKWIDCWLFVSTKEKGIASHLHSLLHSKFSTFGAQFLQHFVFGFFQHQFAPLKHARVWSECMMTGVLLSSTNIMADCPCKHCNDSFINQCPCCWQEFRN